MITLQEDSNVSDNMTIREFIDTLESIYLDYFSKGYLETDTRFGLVDDNTNWYCRLMVQPYLRGDNANYRDPLYHLNFRIAYTLPVTESVNFKTQYPTVVSQEGIRVFSDPIDLYGNNQAVSIPVGWEVGWNGQTGTPEDIFEWFKKLIRKLYKAFSRMTSNRQFGDDTEEYEQYL